MIKKFRYYIQLALITSGLAVSLHAGTERIVTIGGAVTEVVFELGLGDSVVGVDLSSQYPEAATKLPQVGYIRMISAEGVLALEPTHVVTTTDIQPKNALDQIRSSGITLTVVDAPETAEGVQHLIRELGETFERVDAATKMIEQMNTQLSSVTIPEETPGVLFFMSSPGSGQLRAAGTQTKAQAMIQQAGGHNVIESHPGYQFISSESLVALQPDVILIGMAENMPYDRDQVLAGVLENPVWQSVAAVQNKAVHIVPLGKTLGFGPRFGEAALELNALIERESE